MRNQEAIGRCLLTNLHNFQPYGCLQGNVHIFCATSFLQILDTTECGKTSCQFAPLEPIVEKAYYLYSPAATSTTWFHESLSICINRTSHLSI